MTGPNDDELAPMFPVPLTALSLFAGIGGLDLGLERAGMRVVGQVELDLFCRLVLAKHWPEVPRHDDVRTTIRWWRSQPRPAVDVVAGGFPCQPSSLGGRRLGEDDPRWLWPAMRDVVAELRPRWVIFENVIGLRTRGLLAVLEDLAVLGYAVDVGTATACTVGAPQVRRRLFGVAYPASIGRGPGLREAFARHGAVRVDDGAELADGARWDAEPGVGRVVDGVPARLDGSAGERRRALGNAVVPQVAELIGSIVMSARPVHLAGAK